ncbi:hypothetical protein C8R46DRAFT_1086111 [Mycena filopes]|nr:hypothetical protein C8R46DRAFT_1086111 [Mycena filopes]
MNILLTALTSDRSNRDASVEKYIHPAPYIPGPYTHIPWPTTLPYVPSLSWFCLIKLAQVAPDEVSTLIDMRRNYQPPRSDEAYDLLRALIPALSSELDWATVDPRLWATIIQVYDNLPPNFGVYEIPLSDVHLPMLQNIQCSPHFSLLTILELPGCRELSDATIVNLKHLHSLGAFDASSTSLSSHGLKVLAGTVLRSDEDQKCKGPWGLRILRLRHCRNVADDKTSAHLSHFPLLSILDLRGTRCRSEAFIPSFRPAPTAMHELYAPTPLQESLEGLASLCELFSSPNVFTLYINTLHHPATAQRAPVRQTPTEDVCVTFTSSGSTQFRKPELEDLNAAAEQEFLAHSARQNLMSFYHSGAKPRPSNSVRGYHYPPEPQSQPSAKEALLMLYRSPPPWALLEDTLPSPAPMGKPAAEVVTGVSKRKRAEMAEYLERFNEKRRKIQQTAAQSTAGAPESAPLSRNPFRRRVSKEVLGPPSSAPQPLPSKAVNTRLTAPLPPTIPQKRVSSLAPTEPPDHDQSTPRVSRKSAFDWRGWGKK